MRSGNLKHKIVIQELQEVNDGGEMTKTWVDFKTTYSQIVPKRGRELFTSSEVYANMTHTISMRYIANVTSKMRVKYGTRIFEMIAPPVDVRELRVTLELYCKEWEGDVL